jgi:hypothetical protein
MLTQDEVPNPQNSNYELPTPETTGQMDSQTYDRHRNKTDKTAIMSYLLEKQLADGQPDI